MFNAGMTGQDFEKARLAFVLGDYAAALREWSPLAEQGDAEAQAALGLMYSKGLGIPQDYAEAMKWFRKAADQGGAGAQNNLGLMHSEGHGVLRDYAEAVKWYRKAADQGEAGAQNNLGVMYRNGQGVPQDYAEAEKWYRKAADQGHASAQFNLGLMFYEVQGVPQDYAEAEKWYRKAAEQGHASAQVKLGIMYYNGQGVPQDYAEAEKWYRKAADQYDAQAQGHPRLAKRGSWSIRGGLRLWVLYIRSKLRRSNPAHTVAAEEESVRARYLAQQIMEREKAVLYAEGIGLNDKLMLSIELQFLWGVFRELVQEYPDLPTNGLDRVKLHLIMRLVDVHGYSFEAARDEAIGVGEQYNKADGIFDALASFGQKAFHDGHPGHLLKVAKVFQGTKAFRGMISARNTKD